MATLVPRPDRTRIEAEVLAITGELLRELGNNTAGTRLAANATLDEDLGLGSIERVELGARLERSLGVGIPEAALADARTVADIVQAIAQQQGGEGAKRIDRASAEELGETGSNPEAIAGHSSIAEASAPDRIAAESARSDGQLPGRIGEKIYGVYAAIVFSIWVVPTWLMLHVCPRGQPAARMSSAALRLYFRLIGCRLHLMGRENLDASNGACVYVSNHTSYSDVPVVMALFHTNYHFVAKDEINDMPFVGSFLRRIGHFSFDRTKLRDRSRQAEQMEQALLRGESLFIFAEGTFTTQPGVRQFQLGAFRAAVKTGRPIVPVALQGARRFLPDGAFLPRPSRITVTVCPALMPRTSAEGRDWAEVLRLRDESRRIISRQSGEPLF